MKMDHEAFRMAAPVAASKDVARRGPSGAARAAVGLAFLLLAPIVLLPYLAVLAIGLAVTSAVRLLCDCVAYSADVTIGQAAQG